MKSKIVLVLFFFLGFIVHAFFFPDFLYDGWRYFQKQPENVFKNTIPNAARPTDATPFITSIDYENQIFSKRNVQIHLGNYLAITNMQKDHSMWLESDNPYLNTGRAYSYYERVQVRLDTKGIYHVTDKLNPSQTITISVK